MKYIQLTQGKQAIVDNEDYERVSKYKWCFYNNRYAARGIWNKGKKGLLRMHTLITSCPKGMQVDHINGNGLDNRKENLRICEQKQNLRNQKKRSYRKYKGVFKSKEKWRVIITVNYKNIHIGTYNTEIEAAIAYNEAALKYFGEYANLNTIL